MATPPKETTHMARGRLTDASIAAVRETSRIDKIVSEYVTLKKAGPGTYKGLCPFHDEKGPSFHVTPDRGYYHCLAGETGVLTEDGVVPIQELAGRTVRVLTSDGTVTKWVDAPFSSFGVQPLLKITVSRNGRVKDLYATDEHRWFVRAGGAGRRARAERLTKDLKPGDRLVSAFPATRVKKSGSAPSPFGIARGFTYGDGGREQHGSYAQFCGEKDAAMRKWFPHNRFIEMGEGIVRAYDMPAYFKDERPDLDESASYLYGWLAGYFAADGCVADDGDATLASADRKDLEYVERLCARIGVGTYAISTQSRVGFGEAESDIHSIRLMTNDLTPEFFLIAQHAERFTNNPKAYERRGWVVKSVESTDRVEEVFCAVVPETHSFVLEDNILTGNCFGCGEGGDVIDFVQKIESLDFIESIERLAERFRVELVYEDYNGKPGGPDPDRAETRAVKARLIAAHVAAAEFYTAQLFTPEAVDARRYLTDRQFDRTHAAEFGVGYSPNGWDVLIKHLTSNGFTTEELSTAGLTSETKSGHIDRFRGRLMFPIRDQSGDIIGFGARKLLPDDQDKGPKYLNTPETPIYKKSRVLYGLDKARRDISKQRKVVVVEGYTDVMACYLSGETTAVATCGTAFGEEHIRIIRRLLGDDGSGGEVIYTFDGDAAGQKAALKAFTMDAHFQTRTSVAVAESGMDPCELRIAHGTDGVLALLDARIPLFEFAIKSTLSQFDLRTPEGRVNALAATSPIVASIKHHEMRDGYVRQLSRWTGTDQDAIRKAVLYAIDHPDAPTPTFVTGPASPDTTTAPLADVDPYERPDASFSPNSRDALKVVLQNQKFVQLATSELHRNDFTHPTHRAVWEAVLSADADPAADKTQWVNAVLSHTTSPTVASVITELAVDPYRPRAGITQETAAKTFLILAAEGAARRLDRIERMVANPELDDEKLMSLLSDMGKAQHREETVRARLHQIDGSQF
jgi:DNA primase